MSEARRAYRLSEPNLERICCALIRRGGLPLWDDDASSEIGKQRRHDARIRGSSKIKPREEGARKSSSGSGKRFQPIARVASGKKTEHGGAFVILAYDEGRKTGLWAT